MNAVIAKIVVLFFITFARSKPTHMSKNVDQKKTTYTHTKEQRGH